MNGTTTRGMRVETRSHLPGHRVNVILTHPWIHASSIKAMHETPLDQNE